MLKLSTREKRIQLQYLLALFLGSVILLGWAILSNPSQNDLSDKMMLQRIKDEEAYLAAQKEFSPLIDTLYKNINGINFVERADWMENNIQSQLRLLHSIYNQHSDNVRFKIFEQYANFYQLLVYDKQVLASRINNLKIAKQQYENCVKEFNYNQQILNAQKGQPGAY